MISALDSTIPVLRVAQRKGFRTEKDASDKSHVMMLPSSCPIAKCSPQAENFPSVDGHISQNASAKAEQNCPEAECFPFVQSHFTNRCG